MAKPKPEHDDSLKTVESRIKSFGALYAAVLAATITIGAAWGKLEGARPMVIAFLIVTFGLAFYAIYRLRAKAINDVNEAIEKTKLEGEALAKLAASKALSDRDAADVDRSVDSLYIEAYIDPRIHDHGALYHRGGRVGKTGVTVQFGLRASNFGKHRIKIREIKDVNFTVSWNADQIDWSRPEQYIVNADIEGGARQVHVHDVKSPHIGLTISPPPPSNARSGVVLISGNLQVEGDWGSAIKTVPFSGRASVPFAIESTPEINDAVNKLTAMLGEQGVELIDAYVSPGRDGLGWGLVIAPRTAIRVDVVSVESACADKTLEDVVRNAVEKIRSTTGNPADQAPRMRISSDDAESEIEQAAEAEIADDQRREGSE